MQETSDSRYVVQRIAVDARPVYVEQNPPQLAIARQPHHADRLAAWRSRQDASNFRNLSNVLKRSGPHTGRLVNVEQLAYLLLRTRLVASVAN